MCHVHCTLYMYVVKEFTTSNDTYGDIYVYFNASVLLVRVHKPFSVIYVIYLLVGRCQIEMVDDGKYLPINSSNFIFNLTSKKECLEFNILMVVRERRWKESEC